MSNFYDWESDGFLDQAPTRERPGHQPFTRGEVVASRKAEVNQVTGHGVDCQCPRCPGWYVARAMAGFTPVAPPARKPNPLLDQVVPVCCLLAMVSVCGMVLAPVIAPLLAISAMMVVALVIGALGLVVVLLVTAALVVKSGALKGARGEGKVLAGQVVGRRAGWSRRRG